MDFLKSAVASAIAKGPLAPYSVGDRVDTDGSVWTLSNGTKRRTIKFINEEASSVHGSLRVASIFLSESGEWKVGGFDILSSVKDEDAAIFTYSSLVPNLGQLMPPEVSRGSWDVIKSIPVHAIDSFDYGLLVAECFNGTFIPADQAAQASNIPTSMTQTYRRLFHANPKARLSTSNFLDQGRRSGGFFQTPLINLTEGVDKLGLMSDGERDDFFSELDDVSGDFPEDFMKRKILPELLKSVEFGGGGPKVFNVVLQIGAKLPDDEFDSELTPVLIRLFSRQDRAMRVTGFTDQAPLLREQTVKSILTIVSKLSDRTVNGELLKHLAKTANDPEPGIRTNTTICLGKIARNLSAATRSKILVAAFSRSLRDPFMHARNAALLALSATTDLFSEEDCASKILPTLCPSLVDKEKIVRDQANKTIEAYLSRVRKYAQTLPTTMETPTANGSVAGPRIATPSPSADSTWTGWAISSFTNKLSTASGEMSSKPPPVVVGGPGAKAPVTLQPTVTASSNTANTSTSARANPAKPMLPRNTTEKTKLAASFEAPEIVEDDWGDGEWGGIDESADADADDAWGAMAAETEVKPAASPSVSITSPADESEATFSEPEAPKPPATKKQNASAEPDFASWLNAQKSNKNTKTLPKGLTSNKSSSSLGSKTSNRPLTSRTSTSSSLGAKKVVQPPKPAEPKKEQPAADDDWGESWD
ncbi:MAG: hypothetical protein Q9159_007106 [Coniocarpon cinnabarinum]